MLYFTYIIASNHEKGILTMFCKHCGLELPDNVSDCSRYKAPTGSGEQFYHNCGVPVPNNHSAQSQLLVPPNSIPHRDKVANGLCTAGFICFVIMYFLLYSSMFFMLSETSVVSFGILGLILSIAGLIKGRGKRSTSYGLAIASIVFGIIPTIQFVVILCISHNIQY